MGERWKLEEPNFRASEEPEGRGALDQLPECQFDGISQCPACDEAGACRSWALAMSEDTAVPAQWIAEHVLSGDFNAENIGMSDVEEAYRTYLTGRTVS